MKTILTAFALLGVALPVGATPTTPDRGLMTVDPLFGPSRVETVVFCLNEAGVDRYQDLITDSHFDTYSVCMTENT